jgi:hypothetical protein
MKIVTTTAVLAIAVIAATALARADAVSDQKKAYKALGTDLSKNRPALCKLLSKSEVERFLGEPVHDGSSAGPVVSGCVWHAVSNASTGILVTRSQGGGWYPPTASRNYKNVRGIGQQAFTNSDEVGYEASARDAKGVTYVLFSGKGNTRAALDALRIVMKR